MRSRSGSTVRRRQPSRILHNPVYLYLYLCMVFGTHVLFSRPVNSDYDSTLAWLKVMPSMVSFRWSLRKCRLRPRSFRYSLLQVIFKCLTHHFTNDCTLLPSASWICRDDKGYIPPSLIQHRPSYTWVRNTGSITVHDKGNQDDKPSPGADDPASQKSWHIPYKRSLEVLCLPSLVHFLLRVGLIIALNILYRKKQLRVEELKNTSQSQLLWSSLQHSSSASSLGTPPVYEFCLNCWNAEQDAVSEKKLSKSVILTFCFASVNIPFRCSLAYGCLFSTVLNDMILDMILQA